MRVELICTYRKYRRQQQLGGAIIKNNVILTCMTIIDPTMGWFEIIKVLKFDLDEITGGNDEYIDDLSTR